MTHDECEVGMIVRLNRESHSVSAVGQLMKVIRLFDHEHCRCIFLRKDNGDPNYYDYNIVDHPAPYVGGGLSIELDALSPVM